MTYCRFERLMKLKLELVRDLHVAPPVETHSLRRAAEALSERLDTDSNYGENLRRYAHEVGRIG